MQPRHSPNVVAVIPAFRPGERLVTLVEALAARLGLDPDADLYPSLVVATALTVMRVTVKHWQANAAGTPLTALLDLAFDRLADGLVLPPRVAPVQAVIVPIFKTDAERQAVLAAWARKRRSG